MGLTSDETLQKRTLLKLEDIAMENFKTYWREKRLNFLNEQNLVLNQNGANPLWSLTLFHKLQLKTLDEIQEATTRRF